MKKFKGIIFDIDGTLTSTNELIFASFNHITEKYMNKTMTPKEIISLFGPTEDQIIEGWFNENHQEVKDDYYSYYSDNMLDSADLYPGIRELLTFLKSKNVKLSIYTGKGRSAALITLEKLNIDHIFDMIVTGSDVKDHKPSPEGINVFLEKFNLSPDEVLMIGDAPADVIAARRAGVKIASVVWDSYAKEEVLSLGSDYLFESVEELRIFFEEMMN
ncbi:MAG: HAD family hydrolase [Ignavibacteria bacterium]|jgi:HAD superfamily hydrolase (TIGR01549 family)|nr:HAD family hydrolase [Ignavibacteria bacterium]